jgi:hypothetical protein
MVQESDWWGDTLASLRLVQEAFWREARTFRLELVQARLAVTDYIDSGALRFALRLGNLSSVRPQLYRVLFLIGRNGLLVGIGEALRDEHAPVEGQLPERLAALLKQLEA